MTSQTNNVEIVYWSCTFRGNFLKLICEAKGVAYKETTSYQEVKKFLDDDVSKREFPFFAVPYLKVGSFSTSQMAVGCQYLAKKVGLDPDTLEDQTHALMICMNCNDVWVEITRNNGNQQWTDYKDWTNWKDTRLRKWLQIFENLLKRNKNNGDSGDVFFFGKKLSYADTSVYHVIYNLINVVKLGSLIKQYPLLLRLFNQLGTNVNFQKLHKRQEKMAFCGGQIEKSILAMVQKDQEN